MEKPRVTPIEDCTFISDDLKFEKVTVLSDGKAKELISSKDFQNNWDQLYTKCPWSTAFQKRQFVTTWYKAFENEVTPIIAYSFDCFGKMNGLLTLATKGNIKFLNKRIRIFGAGLFESEYQDWLTTPENKDQFIIEAFATLLKIFPKCDVVLRFISEKSFSKKLSEDSFLKPKMVFQSFRRPLMLSCSPEIDQILKLQRKFKNKYRKLNQLGTVRFVKVDDFKVFKSSFGTLMAQFDFRQGAMFNKNQFLDNPAKKNFFYELFQQGLLHVTLLKVDDEIIASMVGIYDKNWLHLQGVNTHSPTHGKYSPGILHFYLLGDLIRKENRIFDLTPGLDEYKERWATDHDWVYTLTLTQNRKFYIKRFLKKFIHKSLIKLGYKPMKVELMLKKQVYLFKKKRKFGRLNKLWKKEALISKRLQLPLKKAFDQLPIEENNLVDLLKYEETKGNLSRWEFMETVMKEMGNKKTIFSYSKNGKMLSMISFGNNVGPKSPSGQRENDSKRDCYFFDNYFCHPDTPDELPVSFLGSVCHMIHLKFNISEIELVYNEKYNKNFRGMF
jgi:hypothetical protein